MALAPERILAVKLADLGDALLATPALRALRTTYPAARLDALVTPHTADLVRHSGLVDRVLTFPKHDYDAPRDLLRPQHLRRLLGFYAMLRRERYDTVALFHHLSTGYGRLKWRLLATATGAARVAGLAPGPGYGWLTHPVADQGFGARHEVEYGLAIAEALGATTADRALALPPFPDEEERAARWLGPDTSRYLVVHAGSGGYSRARRWDPGRFAVVASTLAQRFGLRIVIVGTHQDDGDAVAEDLAAMVPAAPSMLNLQGKTDLADLAAILRRCRLFLGADSGVMHLAAAAGAPVVAIFGPSNHRAWAPWAPDHRVAIVRLGIPCSPCSYVGTGVGLREGCAARTCMAELATEQVLDAALALWRRVYEGEG
jgi:ADP-heptose:LPS heptosyltransferase